MIKDIITVFMNHEDSRRSFVVLFLARIPCCGVF